MADIKRPANPLFLRDEDLRQAMELLYFGYREFTAGADHILDAYGFGRAHHRVIHFIGRDPGLTVKQLLNILQITKQSLARVLKALLEDGFVEQREGQEDRRQRRLYLTDQGQVLEGEIAQLQLKLLRDTFLSAGPEAVEGFRDVMLGLVAPAQRYRFA